MDLAITQSMIKTNNTSVHRPYDKSLVTKNRINSSSRLVSSLAINDVEEETVYEEEDRNVLIIRNLVQKANQKFDEVVNSYNIRRTFTTTVRFYIVFLRVGEIDNVKERFQADAYIESFWEDDTLEGVKKFDPSQHWEPEIFIENAMGNLKQEVKYRIEKIGKTTRVYEMRRVKGFFWEKLELGNFPLDDQDLSITITSSRSKEEVQFELSTENECSINTKDFQQQQEWLLFTDIQSEKKEIFDMYKDYERPAYTISSKIARRPGYFLNNAYMLIFFISILGFVPFSFASTSPHFRIQTTLLLILSSVNFRWIVTQRLPSISYLTILDKYAITALVFLVSLCVWHAIIGSTLFWQLTKAQRDNIDFIALYIIASLFVGFHIVYILFFIWKYLRLKNVGGDNKKEVVDVEMGLREESRPVSISNVKPVVKPSAVNPAVNLIQSDQINSNGEVKYRNLMESPSSSMSGDINNNLTNKTNPSSAKNLKRY